MKYPLIALIGIIVAVITGTIIAAMYRSTISAQDSSKTQQLGGHTPGYPLVKTTGDILDPTSVSIYPKSAAVDAAKYHRQF
jgi:hypothetical protein